MLSLDLKQHGEMGAFVTLSMSSMIISRDANIDSVLLRTQRLVYVSSRACHPAEVIMYPRLDYGVETATVTVKSINSTSPFSPKITTGIVFCVTICVPIYFLKLP